MSQLIPTITDAARKCESWRLDSSNQLWHEEKACTVPSNLAQGSRAVGTDAFYHAMCRRISSGDPNQLHSAIALVRHRYLRLTQVPDPLRTASMSSNFHESPCDRDKENHDLHTNSGQRGSTTGSLRCQVNYPDGDIKPHWLFITGEPHVFRWIDRAMNLIRPSPFSIVAFSMGNPVFSSIIDALTLDFDVTEVDRDQRGKVSKLLRDNACGDNRETPVSQ